MPTGKSIGGISLGFNIIGNFDKKIKSITKSLDISMKKAKGSEKAVKELTSALGDLPVAKQLGSFVQKLTRVNKALRTIGGPGFKGLMKGGMSAFKVMATGAKTFLLSMGPLLLIFAAIAGAFFVLREAFRLNAGGMQDAFYKTWGKIKDFGYKTLSFLRGAIIGYFETVSGYMKPLGDAFRTLFKAFEPILALFNRSGKSAMDWGKIFGKALGALLFPLKIIAYGLAGIIKYIAFWVTSVIKLVQVWHKFAKATGQIRGLKLLFRMLLLPARVLWFIIKGIGKAIGRVIDFFAKAGGMANRFQPLVDVFNAIKSALEAMWNWLKPFVDKIGILVGHMESLVSISEKFLGVGKGKEGETTEEAISPAKMGPGPGLVRPGGERTINVNVAGATMANEADATATAWRMGSVLETELARGGG